MGRWGHSSVPIKIPLIYIIYDFTIFIDCLVREPERVVQGVVNDSIDETPWRASATGTPLRNGKQTINITDRSYHVLEQRWGCVRESGDRRMGNDQTIP